LFGKAGADLIPLLNEGGAALQRQQDYYKRYSGVTEEAIKAADQFNDTLTDLKLLTSAFGAALASDLLRPLQAVAEELRRGKEEAGVFTAAISGIRVAFETVAVLGSDLAFVLTQIVKGIGAVGQAAVALASLDFSGAQTIFSQYNKQAADARRNLDEFQAKVLGFNPNFSNEGRNSKAPPTPPKPAAPRLPGSGAAAAAADAEAALKKALDGQLRLIRAFADQQRDALEFANRFLEGEYQDGLLALENFFGDQKNIRNRALQDQLAEQDAIIAAQQEFARKTKTASGVADATSRIAEANEAKTRAIVRAQQTEQLFIQRNARDLKALEDSFKAVNVQVLELQENFAAAAAARFDLQNSEQRQSFKANIDSPNPAISAAAAQALRDSDALRAAAVAQGAFQKATLATNRTFDELADKEARVALLQQTGALTSLEALARVGAARQAQILVLEREVAAEEAIAAIEKARGTVGADDLVRKAEAGRLALDKLKASADPLAESLNKVFGDDFNSALDDFVTGTKSASEAFKSFAKSVLNDILKLGSKSITESIFGGSGGAGGFISDLFKNQTGPSGGLVGALFGSLGRGSTAAAAPAADDGTTAGIKATAAALGGLGASAATASETINGQTAAVSQSIDAFAGLGASLSSTADAFGSLISDLGSSLGDFLSSLASSGSGGDGIDFASLFSNFAGFFANGGNIGPGQVGVVGENGRELVFGGNSGKTVVPTAQGGVTQNINVSVQGAPGQSRDSLLQQGAAIGAGIQRAMARNT
jgi:hypothetical protein